MNKQQMIEKSVERFIESDAYADYMSDEKYHHIIKFIQKDGDPFSLDEFMEFIEVLRDKRSK